MPRPAAPALLAVAAVVVSWVPLSAQTSRFPSADVRVSLTLDAGGVAHVVEDYELLGSIGTTPLEYLEAPCGAVDGLHASIDGRDVTLRPMPPDRAPWIRAAFAEPSAGRALRVRYDVLVRSREAVVPIVMPAATLESIEGSRGAHVVITATWDGAPGAARAVMPRFETTSPTTWETALLALPSAVRFDIDRPSAPGACDAGQSGSTGGLEWRFAVFVGTMAVWVPAYLLWFRRRWHPAS